jgi:hypothetical protein
MMRLLYAPPLWRVDFVGWVKPGFAGADPPRGHPEEFTTKAQRSHKGAQRIAAASVPKWRKSSNGF